MLKSNREKLAAFCYRMRWFALGCKVRGNHMGLEQVGRCLACGFKRIESRPRVIIQRERQTIQSCFERNRKIRADVSAEGI